MSHPQQLGDIQAQLKTIIHGQGSLMASVQDLQNTVAAIQTAVQQSTTNITQLVTDTNNAIAALKTQTGPVTQAQLDDVVAKNNTILTALTSLNSAISTEDATLAPPAPTGSTPSAT